MSKVWAEGCGAAGSLRCFAGDIYPQGDNRAAFLAVPWE